MSARVRRILGLALLVPALLGVSACSKESQGIKEVQAAIAATRLEPMRFVYSVSTPDAGAFQVQGLVEDDFRYKARLLRANQTVFDEVVNDDAIAVRFAQPDLLGAFVDDEQRDVADLETNLTGVTVIDALGAKRWVLDPVGAPAPTDPARAQRNIGTDPVFDALGVFAYLEQAMREAFEVHRWDAEDLNPAYRASEDVFPRPDRKSGVRRYDLRRPFLPPIGQLTGAGEDDLPATKHFRKMAIYVKDGRIIRIMERVEVTGQAQEDFIDYLVRFDREIGISEEEIEAGRELLRGMSEKEVSDYLLTSLSDGLSISGTAPIAVRTMTLDLVDIGATGIEADLPTDVIEGSLAILLNRGAKPEAAATTSGAPSSDAASGDGSSDGSRAGSGDGGEPSDEPGGESGGESGDESSDESSDG